MHVEQLRRRCEFEEPSQGRAVVIAWVRLDDRRAINAKLRAAGFAARGLDEAAICWSAHEEQDGFVSAADVEMLATLHGCVRPTELIAQLEAVGRWSATERRGAAGWKIKDFLTFNPSHKELEAQRSAKRKAGRLGGIRSGQVRRGESKEEADASSNEEPES